jgi:DNA-binding response OmpR family regulator
MGEEERPSRSKRKRVLIVDDNADMVTTTMALLRLAGHETRGLSDAVTIMDTIREFDPDVVILDLAMPDKDGLAAAREIRKSMPGKRPVLIACSAEHNAHKLAAREAGFKFYVAKPCDPDYLVSLVDQTD